MPRTLAECRRWVTDGTAPTLGRIAGLSEAQVREPSALPDWTVGQVIGHVWDNADGLGNLADWARTGNETPMHASLDARNAAIEQARHKPTQELLSWFTASDEGLNAKFDEFSDEQWQTLVATRLPATEIPWMRAREVFIHATDLGLGVKFEDLPEEFVAALVVDIYGARGLQPDELPQVAAWLAGRRHTLVDAPDLGPWL